MLHAEICLVEYGHGMRKKNRSALVASCCAVFAFGTGFGLGRGFGLAAAPSVEGLDPS